MKAMKSHKRTIVCAMALATFATACSVSDLPNITTGDPAPAPSVTLVQNSDPIQHSSLSSMIEEVVPSVVNVQVTSFAFDPLTGGSEAKGEGSGVVIDRNGIILTNNHVISGAVKVNVVFNDGHDQMEGRVIGSDPKRDIAVVKVNADDLSPITMGHSDEMKLGDTVVALGFPLGLGSGPTVTQGIVSGLDRTIRVPRENGDIEKLLGLLQTDAAINPGNSGGALVDSQGHLVGINTAAAQASSAENVGFAIAIDGALPIVKDILSAPATKKAWLGVQLYSIESSADAAGVGLAADARGAYIAGLVPDGPADQAGLKEGDLIVNIEGHSIGNGDDLSTVLAGFAPGDEIAVSIENSDGPSTLHVTLEERPLSFS
jgi:S1-C subfamily serine protease